MIALTEHRTVRAAAESLQGAAITGISLSIQGFYVLAKDLLKRTMTSLMEGGIERKGVNLAAYQTHDAGGGVLSFIGWGDLFNWACFPASSATRDVVVTWRKTTANEFLNSLTCSSHGTKGKH